MECFLYFARSGDSRLLHMKAKETHLLEGMSAYTPSMAI
jgi:hypothetical protein